MNIIQRLKLGMQLTKGIGDSYDQIKLLDTGSGGKGSGVELAKLVGRFSNRPPVRGVPNHLKAYSTTPWLRAVANRISTAVAMVEWKAFAVKKEGKYVHDLLTKNLPHEQRRKRLRLAKEMNELVEIESHPLVNVLNLGNPVFPGYTNTQLLQIYIDLVGEGFWVKQRDGLGKVVSLWPIPPHWIRDFNLADKEVVVSHGDFTGVLDLIDLVWVNDPNPFDPYDRGRGFSQTLSDELETDEYAAKYVKNFFFNDAKPPLIVAGEDLGKGERERFEQRWLEKNRGFMKAFTPFFMGHGGKNITIKELSNSLKSMEFTQLREFERNQVIQVFGVPPEMLGILDNSNRSTIEVSERIFTRWVVIPRLERMRSAFQVRLVPDFDERIILDYDSPEVQDKTIKLDIMRAAPFAYSVDEYRELSDHPPIGEDNGGSEHWAPFSWTTVDQLGMGASEPEADEDIDELEEEAEQGNGNVELVTDSVVSPEGYYISADQTRKQLSSDDKSTINRIVASMRNVFMVKALTPVLRETTSSFGKRTMNNLSPGSADDFLIDDPEVVAFLTTETGKRIKATIDATTTEKLTRSLVQGMEQGESEAQLADRVEGVFGTSRKGRAKTIARTETVRASNFGTQAGMSQSGLKGKSWLSVRDGSVRDGHGIGPGSLDGTSVKIGSNFKSSLGGSGPFPGSLGVAGDDVNCRCTIIPDEFKSFTEQQKTQMWKSFESNRLPFQRKALTETRKGFDQQEVVVLKALRGE